MTVYCGVWDSCPQTLITKYVELHSVYRCLFLCVTNQDRQQLTLHEIHRCNRCCVFVQSGSYKSLLQDLKVSCSKGQGFQDGSPYGSVLLLYLQVYFCLPSFLPSALSAWWLLEDHVRPALELNPGFHSENPATDHLKYGMAYSPM